MAAVVADEMMESTSRRLAHDQPFAPVIKHHESNIHSNANRLMFFVFSFAQLKVNVKALTCFDISENNVRRSNIKKK
jgi:hypothetical protein